MKSTFSLSISRSIAAASLGVLAIVLAFAIPAQADTSMLGDEVAPEPAIAQDSVTIGEPPSTAGLPGGSSSSIAYAKSAEVGAAQGFSIDIQDREAVRTFYNSVFQGPEGMPSGWSASQATPGTLSTTYLEAIRQRVNWYRAMAGAPSNVTFLPAYNSSCQQAALMMSRNNAVNHSPPTSWSNYTAAGAESAFNSNLALGSSGYDAIVRYMQDSGSANADTGHRRWILHPSIANMGAGSVDTHTVGSNRYLAAQAIRVNDADSYKDVWPTVRDKVPGTTRGIIAWPPPGYTPSPQVFPRWSLSVDRVTSNASNAIDASTTVTMTKNGVSLAVSDIQRPSNMGKQMTIVFTPSGYSSSADVTYARPTQDDVYVVNVVGVLLNGVRSTVSYTVRVFDPSRAASDINPTVVTGSAAPYINQPNAYSHSIWNFATSYRLTSGQPVNYSAVEGAEAGLTNFTPVTAGGYTQTQGTTKDTGNSAFRLAHSSASREVLCWNKVFIPASGAVLSIRSRLRQALPAEVARVQISTNGGIGWSDLVESGFPKYGVSNGDVEGAFTTSNFNLSAYVGRLVMFRFVFEVIGYGQYYLVNSNTGWYIDNISVTNTKELTQITDSAINEAAGSANYSPTDANPRILAVQPVVWLDYGADYGLPLAISPSVMPANPTEVWITGTTVSGSNLNINFAADNVPANPTWRLMGNTGVNGAYVPFTGATFHTVNAATGQYCYIVPIPAESTCFFRVEVQ